MLHTEIMNTKQVSINFNQLVREYWDNLTNTLRSFQASEEHEFLEMWVPNDDPILCIKDIVDLAASNQIEKLIISIKCDDDLKIQAEDIVRLAKEIGGKISLSSEKSLILVV